MPDSTENSTRINDRYDLIAPAGGPGGFAEVWRAYDYQLEREVAVKILHKDRCTPEIFARFDLEKEISGKMRHPNIAQVFEAGLYLGRPYLVMEYVAGLPLDQYCTKYELPITERLALFIEVCDGVQHAHECFVLHRDLKPSNILVERMVEMQGDKKQYKHRSKVIDFGISKVLNYSEFVSSAPETRRDLLLGTTEYMSPEQASLGAEEVTVRSDVYALGCILFELLAGDTPIPHETARILESGPAITRVRTIQQTEVEQASRRILTPKNAKPSFPVRHRLSEIVSGDLDAILGQALAKESQRRYPSVIHFADDLVRFLNHEPVKARPLGPLGRGLKFVRRNRLLSAGIGLTATAMLAATFISTSFYLSEAEARRQEAAAKMTATSQRIAAERARKLADNGRDAAFMAMTEAEDLSNFLLFDLREQLDAIGRTKLLNAVSLRSEEYLAWVEKNEAALEKGGVATSIPRHQRNRGVMYYNRGQIFLAQGDLPAAAKSFDSAIAIYEQYLLANADVITQQDSILAWDGKAVALLRAGDLEEAGRILQKQLEALGKLQGEDTSDGTRTTHLLAVTYERLGDLAKTQSKWKEALAYYEKMQEPADKLLSVQSPLALNLQAVCWEKLGTVYLGLNEFSKALSYFGLESDQLKMLSQNEPDNVRLQRALSVAFERQGMAGMKLGRFEEATANFELRLKMAEALAFLDPTNNEFARDLATARQHLGVAFRLAARPGTAAANSQNIQKAVRLCQESFQNFSALEDKSPSLQGAREDAGIAQIQLGLSLLAVDPPNRAEVKKHLEEGLRNASSKSNPDAADAALAAARTLQQLKKLAAKKQ